MKTRNCLLFLGLAFCFTGIGRAQNSSFEDAFGPFIRPAVLNNHRTPDAGLDPVHRWNQIALIATGLDHTPVAPGEDRVFGEQFGPCRAARAMAIIHIAIFDAVNTIVGGYNNYLPYPRPNGPVSIPAAVAQGAHDTLVALYPSQAPSFDTWLAEDLDGIPDGTAKTNGVAVGKGVCANILSARELDGSEIPEPILGIGWYTSDQPGHWRQDPISLIPIALGAYWSKVLPFVMKSSAQFHAPAPPYLTSTTYTAAFNETKSLGGDGVTTRTERTPTQTFIGIYWAYDGTPSMCAPPRLYNQIAVQVADDTKLQPVQLARLLALVNVAMADAGIACWESKYYWDYWRPVTAIREADPGTGPTGKGDGNPDTHGDVTFSPLGAPASNLSGPDFTPPFPSYPSGHATFGGAVFEVLRRFYGTDQHPFTFISDEWNGITKDNDGRVRPYRPRFFETFSEAEEENGQSRIYLGIHWSFDKDQGIAQGNRVGDYVFDHVFLPVQ